MNLIGLLFAFVLSTSHAAEGKDDKTDKNVADKHDFSEMSLRGKLKGPEIRYSTVEGNRRDLPLFDIPENFNAEIAKIAEEF